MDQERFDALLRAFGNGARRREVVGLLAGLAGLAGLGLEEGVAKGKRRKGKRKAVRQQKRGKQRRSKAEGQGKDRHGEDSKATLCHKPGTPA